ncbi:MAG TPA: HAD family phosphatase [Candidatus Saccharimonadales bacterium]|nr:HAD family phosphatase [Candidatus Saccharimonadales bacterium]
MIKAIIFDCFGVLYPQASGHFYERHKELFDNDPATMDRLNDDIDLGKISRAEFFEGLEQKTGMPARKIQEEIDEELVLDRNVTGLIRKLKSSYKIGFLSNAGEEEIELIYRDEIDSLFDAICVSYKTGVLKPEARAFEICAQNLGVKPTECLFVDDSTKNIEGAKKLGMKTILYTSFDEFSEKLKESL